MTSASKVEIECNSKTSYNLELIKTERAGLNEDMLV